MRAYKYLSTEFALKTIVEHRIKISDFADMNDPFELWGVSLSDPKVHEILVTLAKEMGVICLSSEWDNPLLWSHYADKHRGFCLGFEIGSGIETVKPDYVETRLTAPVESFVRLARARHIEGGQTPEARREAKEPLMRMLRTKFKNWEYENEVRLFASKELKECGLFFHSFDDNFELRDVIAGVRCCVQQSTIETWLEGYGGVRVMKVRLAEDSFKLIEDPKGFGS